MKVASLSPLRSVFGSLRILGLFGSLVTRKTLFLLVVLVVLVTLALSVIWAISTTAISALSVPPTQAMIGQEVQFPPGFTFIGSGYNEKIGEDQMFCREDATGKIFTCWPEVITNGQ